VQEALNGCPVLKLVLFNDNFRLGDKGIHVLQTDSLPLGVLVNAQALQDQWIYLLYIRDIHLQMVVKLPLRDQLLGPMDLLTVSPRRFFKDQAAPSLIIEEHLGS
jgi:hypothetical protein